MPRIARFIVPGCFYHITQRGNDRRNVFLDDHDRRKYLFWLEEYRAKHHVEIFAYCLMNNHVHFIVRANEQGFSRLFSETHMCYAQYYHRRYETSGHLWQGRFYSCLLQESHFHRAVRYVERNPVRAGLVGRAGDWPWSSSRTHLEIDKGIVFLNQIEDYISMENWQDYLGEEEPAEELDAIRCATKSGRVFGSKSFIQDMESKYGKTFTKPPMGRPKK